MVMLLYPWTLLSLSDEKSITSFRLPEAVGVNSSVAVARSLGPTVPTLKGGKKQKISYSQKLMALKIDI